MSIITFIVTIYKFFVIKFMFEHIPLKKKNMFYLAF